MAYAALRSEQACPCCASQSVSLHRELAAQSLSAQYVKANGLFSLPVRPPRPVDGILASEVKEAQEQLEQVAELKRKSRAATRCVLSGSGRRCVLTLCSPHSKSKKRSQPQKRAGGQTTKAKASS